MGGANTLRKGGLLSQGMYFFFLKHIKHLEEGEVPEDQLQLGDVALEAQEPGLNRVEPEVDHHPLAAHRQPKFQRAGGYHDPRCTRSEGSSVRLAPCPGRGSRVPAEGAVSRQREPAHRQPRRPPQALTRFCTAAL